VCHDLRDEVVDYVRHWSARAERPMNQVVGWVDLGRGKYYNWRERYGKVNEHNAWVPRDHWLLEWEKEAIIDFHADHPLEGYRRLTYMLMDDDVVAASPSSVYRVLKQAGLLKRWKGRPSKKGTGFHQPQQPHQHWHIDVSYLNVCGTFYYLCSVLDGFSRYIVHWEIRRQMIEQDVEIILQRAHEKFPKATPRIISDNGPQFIAKDFKTFIRLMGMTHVKTSPFYPQSNGKLERWHQSLKSECIRPKTPLSLEEARRVVGKFVEEYNAVRLHSSIGYIAPKDKLEGRAEQIHAERDRKLEEAREQRKRNRQLRKNQLTNRGEEGQHSTRPVKRKQALLGSNLPRDNRIRRENDSVAPGGLDRRAFFHFLVVILLSCHALKTHSDISQSGKRRPGLSVVCIF